MNLKSIVKIFFKATLWWLIILTILFFDMKEVNLSYVPRYDRIVAEKPKTENINKLLEETTKDIDKLELSLKEKEKKIQEEKKRQLEAKTYLIDVVNTALDNNHYSASKYELSYKKLCSYYKKYCKIIDISETEFTDKKRLYYTAIAIYLIKYLKEIFPNIDNEIYYLKFQKEKIWRRGYAGHHSIVMNIKSQMSYKQFLEVLTHEMWHIVDLWVIKGSSWWKDPNFTEFGKKVFSKDDKSLRFYKLSWNSEKIKNPYSYAKDFVSGYALTDPFEDFAETFNMYVNHNAVFIKMAKESNILKQKYNFMNSLMKGEYLSADRKFYYKDNFRPRDSTKMK